MKKLLITLSIVLGFAGMAYATAGVPISVPQAPGANYVLLSTTTGKYIYVATSSLGITGSGGTAILNTNPFQATYFTATSTTATSTFPIASSTCFWNGTACLTSGGAGTPSGASSTIQFNANGAFGGSSNFVFNGTNVGIGTSTPSNALEVAGNGYFAGNLTAGNITATSTFAGPVTLGYGSFSSPFNKFIINYNIAAWGDSLTYGNGGTPYPTQLSNNFGFNVYNGGNGGDTSAQILSFFNSHPEKLNDTHIIWSGRNDINTSTSSAEANIATMVAAIPEPKKYIILSVLNGSTEYNGTANYNWTISFNSDLASIYGSHYFDIRSYLISACNPSSQVNITGWYASTTQDQTDCANGIYPTSLSSDGLHLNTAGYGVVARAIDRNISRATGEIEQPISQVRLGRLLYNFSPVFASTTSIHAIKVENGDLNSTLGDQILFANSNYPDSYLSKISTSAAGGANNPSNIMAFSLSDGTATGYITPLTLTGDNKIHLNGTPIINTPMALGTGAYAVSSPLGTLELVDAAVNVPLSHQTLVMSYNGTQYNTSFGASFSNDTLAQNFLTLSISSGASTQAANVQTWYGNGNTIITGGLNLSSSTAITTIAGNVGIGTTSPPSTLTVKGHIGTDGAIPALTSCGTSPAITSGSTDTAGEITEGTISTGCVITFASAYARAPFVVLSAQSGLVFTYTISNTAITITNVGALSSTKINYMVVSNDL